MTIWRGRAWLDCCVDWWPRLLDGDLRHASDRSISIEIKRKYIQRWYTPIAYIYYYSNSIRATVKNIKEKNHHDDDENIASSTINNTTSKEKYNKILEEAEPCPSKWRGKESNIIIKYVRNSIYLYQSNKEEKHSNIHSVYNRASPTKITSS